MFIEEGEKRVSLPLLSLHISRHSLQKSGHSSISHSLSSSLFLPSLLSSTRPSSRNTPNRKFALPRRETYFFPSIRPTSCSFSEPCALPFNHFPTRYKVNLFPVSYTSNPTFSSQFVSTVGFSPVHGIKRLVFLILSPRAEGANFPPCLCTRSFQIEMIWSSVKSVIICLAVILRTLALFVPGPELSGRIVLRRR